MKSVGEMYRLLKDITGEKEKGKKPTQNDLSQKREAGFDSEGKKTKRNISKQAFSRGLIILSHFIFRSCNF